MAIPPTPTAAPDLADHTQRTGVGLAWFLVVGCCSAAVHWVTVVYLVTQGHWQPLSANGVGWLLALCVSFTGHHQLSFKGHGAALGASARRFFVISAAGFVVNEAAYAVLLRNGSAHFELTLAAVLVAVAVFSYLLSRRWAFLPSPRP